MLSMPRRVVAIASTMSVLAVAAPVAGAAAADTPSTPIAAGPSVTLPAVNPLLLSWPALHFTPPSVGPIAVYIGPVIISNQMISPGLYVSLPGFSPPPFFVGANG